jgi:benzoate/toluate 1,2-dioxygenase reductase subunit
MTHLLALNFEDGVTQFVHCHEGDTVAKAAYRSNIDIPACGVGASQMRPQMDRVIDIAASSHACKTGASRFAAVIRVLQRLSPTTSALSLELSRPISFLPGQYARILVPGSTLWRAYSFSTASQDADIRFLIRHIADGSMSTFLAERAHPGMTLEVNGPRGNFYLRDIRRPLLFLAGGTGVASLLAILEQLVQRGTNGQPVHLVYGVSRKANLVERERLTALAARVPDFSFEICISRESGNGVTRGHVTDVLDPSHLHGGEVDVYVAGPVGMVEATRRWLQDKHVSPTNVYAEKFS